MKVKLTTEIDERIWQAFTRITGGIELSTSQILSALIIDWLARYEAELLVYKYIHRSCFEFSDRGSDEALLNSLIGLYRGKYENEWRDAALNKARYGAPLEQDEKAYIEALTEREHERAEMQERFKEAVADGLIPEDFDGAPSTALSWLEDYQEGRIDSEQYEARFKYYKEHAGWGKE